MNYKKIGIILGAGTILGTSSAFANLVINPTFSAGILGDANSAQIQATINQAISFYNTHYTDNITVNINFDNPNSGLGSSSTGFVGVTYSQFRTALAADASTADDALALAHLPTQTNDPITNAQTTIALSKANARALGFSTSGGADSSITLNTSICNLVHGVNTNSSFYDLYAVCCHEIDEALGTVAFVGSAQPSSADLFRYNGGVRSWDTSTTHQAFFSIDGTNNIVEYNQLNRSGGDWGDWIHHNGSPQVQDFSGTPGTTVNMGASETRLLDVVGYNYVVPEPASFAVLGIGAMALIRRRKRA
jgi:hypothetical protein